MSTIRTRSKTGCLTCKSRRKKCDETWPVCERCVKAGMRCLGYSHLEASTKIPRQSWSTAHKVTTSSISLSQPAHPISVPLNENWASSPGDFLYGAAAPATPHRASGFLQLSYPMTAANSGVLLDSSQNTYSVPASSIQRFGRSTDFVSRRPIRDFPAILPRDVKSNTSDSIPIHSFNSYPHSIVHTTLAQTGSYPTLFGLGRPDVSASVASVASHSSMNSHGSPRLSLGPGDGGFTSLESDTLDMESMTKAICCAPTLDQDTFRYSLSFALYSYSKWFDWALFEPQNTVDEGPYYIILRYNRSEYSRRMMVLAANVVHTLTSAPSEVDSCQAAIALLCDYARRKLALAISREDPTTVAGLDGIDALVEMSQMSIIMFRASSLRLNYDWIRETAPAYRRVCPEPHGTPINLARKLSLLLSREFPFYYFPFLDILFSVIVCKPTHLQYDLSYELTTSSFAENSKNIGLQWMDGIPNQFVVLLARMYMLYASSSPNIYPSIITEIQQEIRDFQPILGASPDSLQTVMRLGMQEAWRQVLYIYLYMGLCGASARDDRVQAPLRSFIRLLEGITPSRNPDAFLLLPMIIAAIAACERQHRETIRRRMLGLRECSQLGTLGYELATIIRELWAWTDTEARPATWSDWRGVVAMVSGIE